ncbi:PilZ domain-containing protein [Stakelama marina]|uniref:PilZ domain-containing protein n=1 Tax=Stakelama marina TaxID=2826939 RepID=A0A8T4IGI9_9SPHN|nr:PilZ domain-containing protein [Stakelama marina]MBR0551379.1 PilZ domain-containing protein [Stakelama marina]
MSWTVGNLAVRDQRSVDRDEVHYRARAFGPDAKALTLLVVNISPHGLMARAETTYREGEKLRVSLPVAGTVDAEIRWSLGGRIGCQFDPPIDRASYYELLAAMVSA